MRKQRVFIFLFLSFFGTINGDHITVLDFNTPIRILPHDDAHKLGVGHKNDTFTIIYQNGDWYHIKYKTLPAWIHSQYVTVGALDTVVLDVTRSAALPESSAAAAPGREKSKPIVLKSTDSAVHQNNLAQNTESKSPKKPIGKSQSKQARALEPEQSIPQKKTSPGTTKQGDTVSRHSDSLLRAVASNEPLINKKKPSLPIPSLGTIVILIGAAVFVLFVSFAIKKWNQSRKRAVKTRGTYIGKDALIIANSRIAIFNSLTNTSVSITDYLSEIGFTVHFYPALSNAETYLLHYVPDIVLVDWQLEKNIQNAIVSIFSSSKTTATIEVVFYHVPNPSPTIQVINTIIHAHFLGMTLSDQDISKIIVPLLKLNNKEKRFTESIQATALEGEIQKGNLAEVLQFIEMGKKTGCLYVVKETPFGIIYFEHGQVVYAASPNDQGKAAVLQMLDLTSGHFHFVINKASPTKNISISCLEIVVEWTRIHDEADRRIDAPAASRAK